MRIVYIYVLIDPRDDKIRYVGKTINPTKRFKRHIENSRWKSYHSSRWIKSLYEENLIPIMKIIEETNEEKWEEREIFWIKYYREIFDLTNLTDGGNNYPFFKNKKHTEKSKNKMSTSRKGISINQKDDEGKRRAAIIKYCESIKRTVYQYSLEGKFIKEWNCAIEASKILNCNHSNLHKVCKGERNICGDYRWSYERKDNIGLLNKEEEKLIELENIQKWLNENKTIKEIADILNMSKRYVYRKIIIIKNNNKTHE